MEQLGQEDPGNLKRLVWAMLLMAVVFGAMFTFMRAPQPPPSVKASEGKRAASTPAAPAEQPKLAPSSGSGSPESAAPESQAVAGEKEERVVLENPDLSLEISSKGAVLTRAILKKYGPKGGLGDDLVSPLSGVSGSFPLSVLTGDKAFDQEASGALFHVEQFEGGGAKGVRLAWSDGKGNGATKTITLPASGYEIGLQVSAQKDGKPLAPVPLTWGPGLGKLQDTEAKSRYFQQEYVALSQGGAYKKVQRAKIKAGDEPVKEAWGDHGTLDWVAMSNNYFAAIFLPEGTIHSASVITLGLTPEEQKVHPAATDIRLVVGFPEKGRLFIGPKEWKGLNAMGGNLYRLQDWGWLAPICGALLWSLKALYKITANYGVAILLLTFLIKLAFYPLTQRSMVKMKEMGEGMKKLKPQLDRLKAKYKKMPKDMGNRAKMNEEMMAIYQREGINPLGGMSGCLPLVLQLPIFFALFTLLSRSLELRGAPFFGWIQDLSIQDPYYITPLIMGVSMVASTKMTSTQGMEGSQKLLLWFMPVMFTFWCLNAPAGLALYWLTNNVLTIGQQVLINRQVAARQEEAARARKSTPKGPSKPS